jgi:uncharacterized protein
MIGGRRREGRGMTTIDGERIIDAPRERVFAALIDPEVVAGAVPLIRSHKELDEDHWEAKVKAPVPLAPTLKIRFLITERRPPERASIQTHGSGAHVLSSFDLEPAEDGRTRIRWRAQIALSGLLARFAGHGLEPLARRAADRVLDRVATHTAEQDQSSATSA